MSARIGAALVFWSGVRFSWPRASACMRAAPPPCPPLLPAPRRAAARALGVFAAGRRSRRGMVRRCRRFGREQAGDPGQRPGRLGFAAGIGRGLAGQQHRRAVGQPVAAVGDHLVADLDAGVDRRALAGAGPDLDHVHLGRAVVDREHIVALGAVAHRLGRDHHLADLGVDQELHIDELAGEQHPVWIVEPGLGLDRPGRGVDLVVPRQQRPLRQNGGRSRCGHSAVAVSTAPVGQASGDL